jgi:7-cyano-7-deazaguanine reductase
VSDRFLDSDMPVDPAPELQALGHAGSTHYFGLETFPNPGVRGVAMTSDEFTAVCPITGQPDQYTIQIEYAPDEKCIESKSLKLFLGTFRNQGAFVETLAVDIMKTVAEVLEVDEDNVLVTIVQKSRGGISIKASA